MFTESETWISYMNQETEQQTTPWRHSTSPKPNKFKQSSFTSGKMMATVFWDVEGVLQKKRRG